MTKKVSSDPDRMYSPVSFQDMVLTCKQSARRLPWWHGSVSPPTSSRSVHSRMHPATCTTVSDKWPCNSRIKTAVVLACNCFLLAAVLRFVMMKHQLVHDEAFGASLPVVLCLLQQRTLKGKSACGNIGHFSLVRKKKQESFLHQKYKQVVHDWRSN